MSREPQARPLRVSVRPGRRNDAKRLGEFFMEAWRESGPGALGFTGATDGAIMEIASEDFLAKRLSSPNARIVVAEEEGRRIVGFASVRGGAQGRAELSGMVVLREASGKGVGTKLVRKALDAARRHGYREVTVKTEAVNAKAIGFYRKNGFTESGKGIEKVGRTRVPVQILLRRL